MATSIAGMVALGVAALGMVWAAGRATTDRRAAPDDSPSFGPATDAGNSDARPSVSLHEAHPPRQDGGRPLPHGGGKVRPSTGRTGSSPVVVYRRSPVTDNLGLPHGALLNAIRQVESGGDDKAIGDGGRSRGPLQCSKAAWADATRYGGVDWDYNRHVWSWPHAAQVARWYWRRYRCKTDEARARTWNGGPAGPRKKDTLKYWRRVQAALAKGEPK